MYIYSIFNLNKGKWTLLSVRLHPEKIQTCKEKGIKSSRSYEVLSHREVGFRGVHKVHLPDVYC